MTVSESEQVRFPAAEKNRVEVVGIVVCERDLYLRRSPGQHVGWQMSDVRRVARLLFLAVLLRFIRFDLVPTVVSH